MTALLAAAAGRPLPHELRGKDAVVAAFVRASQEAPVRPVRPDRRPRVVGLLTRSLAIKVAVAAAVLFGGVAFAATKSALPDPIQAAAHDVFAGLGVPAPESAPTKIGSDGRERDGDSDDDAEVRPRPTATPDGSAREKLAELCRDFRQAQRDGNDVEPSDWAVLTAAAGGAAKVADYCATLVGDQVRPSPEENPPTQTGTEGGSTPDDHTGGSR